MASSIGGAMATGLERGMGMALRVRQQENDEARQNRRDMLDDIDRRTRDEDRARLLKRQQDGDALTALDAQIADLRARGEGLAAQYGGAVPPDIAAQFQDETARLSGMRSGLLEERYRPLVNQHEQRARDIASRLQAGQMTLDDVSDGDLASAIHVTTRRDLSDFIPGRAGEKSVIEQAAADIEAGLGTKNEGLLLRGMNALLAPELRVGVGHDSPHGGKVVRKELIKLIPDPADPKRFMPVVRVYVANPRDGGPALKDGATGYYDAPLTQNRSSDPEDPVRSIDIDAAFGYLEKMRTIARLFDDPKFRARVEKGAAAVPADFAQALYMLKGKMPAKRKVEAKEIRRGDGSVIQQERYADTGELVGERDMGGRRQPGGALALDQVIRQRMEETGQSWEDAAADVQELGISRPKPRPMAGRSGSRGGGKAGDGGVKPADAKRIGDEAEKQAAMAAGLVRGPGGSWVTQNGLPASTATLDLLQRVRAAAMKDADRQARRGRVAVSEAVEAGRSSTAPSPAAPGARQAPAAAPAAGGVKDFSKLWSR